MICSNSLPARAAGERTRGEGRRRHVAGNRTDMATIFISYSHAAENRKRSSGWKRQLLEQLRVFSQAKLVDAWSDESIPGGWRWEHEIDRAIDSAKVAILLLTAESLRSEFIVQHEFPALRRRQSEGGLAVLPILCEPCEWREDPWLAAMQIRPWEARALAEMPDSGRDREMRRLAIEVASIISRAALGAQPQGENRQCQVDLQNLAGEQAAEFIGREQELALLDLALSLGRTAVVSLVAWGGVGKTALTRVWLGRLERAGWLDFECVFGWSFQGEGAGEDREEAEDLFLERALAWFAIPHEPAWQPWEKGRLLAEAIGERRTLLVLDGLEPLQYPPGPQGGRIRAAGIESLLAGLERGAGRKARSLSILTTREAPGQFEAPAAIHVDLGNLDEEAGAMLLHRSGARYAGAVEISGDDPELMAASRELGGHALTLRLLGRFLQRAHEGDIRRRDVVAFESADLAVDGGLIFRMLAAFEKWFRAGGDFGMRRLAAMRIVGLFNRPAEADSIRALRSAPPLDGLTEALFIRRADTAEPVPEEDFHEVVSFLEEFGLLARVPRTGALDCHRLIREYFATQVRRDSPQSWKQAHGRLFEHLNGTIKPIARPGLEDLQPAYRAAHHACEAKWFPKAAKLYERQMMHSPDEHYSWFFLGAFESDLQLFSGFFESRWDRPSPELPPPVGSWLWGEVGYCLRSVGRLREALVPLNRGAEEQLAAGHWMDAATGFCNLSEVLTTLGQLQEAAAAADRSAEIAKRIFPPAFYPQTVAALAHIYHQQGRVQDSAELFRRAAGATFSPERPMTGLAGYQAAELELRMAEAAAVFVSLGFGIRPDISTEILESSRLTERNAAEAVAEAEQTEVPVFAALAALTSARAAFYGSMLLDDGGLRREKVELAARHLREAERMSRAGGMLEFRPALLLTRSWLNASTGLAEAAIGDLNEAWQIARRSDMRLFLTDIHLYRARLFYSFDPYPWESGKRSPEDDLEDARTLIRECHYERRREELDLTDRVVEDFLY